MLTEKGNHEHMREEKWGAEVSLCEEVTFALDPRGGWGDWVWMWGNHVPEQAREGLASLRDITDTTAARPERGKEL